MKVFVSSDMEGTAGIVDWAQCIGPGPEYQAGRRLLLAEVNAAIGGALEAGATEVVVNDSHWTMRNLPPEELAGGASYVSGRGKPLYMMQGLDGTFDAVLFVSYHGSFDGEASVLSHTYNPDAIDGVRVDGRPAGESGINALVAAHFGVPVVLVTGDRATVGQARAFMPGVEGVVVKESLSRTAAVGLHPERARELIREAARRGVERATSIPVPEVAPSVRLEVSFQKADLAEAAQMIRGVDRAGTRAVTISGESRLDVYRRFVAVVMLTRAFAER